MERPAKHLMMRGGLNPGWCVCMADQDDYCHFVILLLFLFLFFVFMTGITIMGNLNLSMRRNLLITKTIIPISNC